MIHNRAVGEIDLEHLKHGKKLSEVAQWETLDGLLTPTADPEPEMDEMTKFERFAYRVNSKIVSPVWGIVCLVMTGYAVWFLIAKPLNWDNVTWLFVSWFLVVVGGFLCGPWLWLCLSGFGDLGFGDRVKKAGLNCDTQ